MTPIIEYRYLPPMYQAQPMDGGFRISVWEQGFVCFECLNTNNAVYNRQTFQIPMEAVTRCRNLVARNAWWTASLSENHWTYFRSDAGHLPAFVAVVRLETVSSRFCFEDMPYLMEAPFRTLRGHYSRLMYILLEDISAVLFRYGIRFNLADFDWDRSMILSMEQQQQMQQNMPVSQDSGWNQNRFGT